MKTKPTSIRFDEEKLKFFQEKYPEINTPQKVIDHFLDVFWWRHHVTKKYDEAREYPLTQNEAISDTKPESSTQVPKPTETPNLDRKKKPAVNIQDLNVGDKTNYTINTEKHPLWKQGDPRENTAAFVIKYGCSNYSELEKLEK